MNAHLAFLGLGSNLGDGSQQLEEALARLAKQVGNVKAVSKFITSEPWGFESKHVFTNAVAAVDTPLDPLPLLDATQAIERQMGRSHKRLHTSEPYHDRLIDIDILLYDHLTYQHTRLTIPHPLLAQRDFVLLPLLEVLAQLHLNPADFDLLH